MAVRMADTSGIPVMEVNTLLAVERAGTMKLGYQRDSLIRASMLGVGFKGLP